jgi:ribosomal protein L29
MPSDELKAENAEELRAEIAALRSELENLRQKWDADLDRVLREIA